MQSICGPERDAARRLCAAAAQCKFLTLQLSSTHKAKAKLAAKERERGRRRERVGGKKKTHTVRGGTGGGEQNEWQIAAEIKQM